MTREKALEALLYHQRWRLGEDIPMKYAPLEITAALDVAIESLKGDIDELGPLCPECGCPYSMHNHTCSQSDPSPWPEKKGCEHEYKGISGPINPTGEPFTIDYVCRKCGYMP